MTMPYDDYENDFQKNNAVAEWLSFCLEKLQSGKQDEIPRNPYYKSTRGIITDDYCDRIVAALDKEFEHESKTYPQFHLNASGSIVPPEFKRLNRRARRALTEGIDRLLGFEQL